MVDVGRLDELTAAQAAAGNEGAGGELGSPEVLASADAKLPALGEVDLVGGVEAVVGGAELVVGTVVLGVAKEDQARDGLLGDDGIEDVGDVGKVGGGAVGDEVLVLHLEAGEKGVADSAGSEVEDGLGLVVVVADDVALLSQLPAAEDGAGDGAAVAVSQESEIAVHVREAIGDGEGGSACQTSERRVRARVWLACAKGLEYMVLRETLVMGLPFR